MIATVVNCLAVIIGSLIGFGLRSHIKNEYETVVYDGAGITTIVIGLSMALASKQIIYLALSLIIGGLLGTHWDIDEAILKFGSFLERYTQRKRVSLPQVSLSQQTEQSKNSSMPSSWDFGHGFLNASVLFCVGALSLVGSFKAGTEEDYALILTKSVLDGFMAILMTATMGPGVAFSALSILIYQGVLTIGAVYLKPFVSSLMISELSAVGGAMVLMIGCNLLSLKQIKTANFLPALLVIVVLTLLDPVFIQWAKGLGV